MRREGAMQVAQSREILWVSNPSLKKRKYGSSPLEVDKTVEQVGNQGKICDNKIEGSDDLVRGNEGEGQSNTLSNS